MRYYIGLLVYMITYFIAFCYFEVYENISEIGAGVVGVMAGLLYSFVYYLGKSDET